MSKPVPRSRLNITYRTRIEGKPVKQKLPFRLLVLGDFTGGAEDKLQDREINSILPGMNLDSFMNELEVMAPIEDHELSTKLAGSLSGQVTGTVKRELPEGKAMVRLTGTATVSGQRGDNGLGSFRGEVTLGADVEVGLADEKVTFDDKAKLRVTGKVNGDITGVIDAEIAFAPETNPMDVDTIASNVSAIVPVRLTIPLHGMKAFTPERVSMQVPEIHRLMLIRRLLLELRAYISNRVELREMLKSILRHEDLPGLRDWLIANYPKLQIAPASKSSTTDGGGSTSGTSGSGSGSTSGASASTASTGSTTGSATRTSSSASTSTSSGKSSSTSTGGKSSTSSGSTPSA